MNKKTQNDSKEILFVCVENAGRSQMAEAFADKYGLIARSAGTFPSTKINPLVVEAMKKRKLVDWELEDPKGKTLEEVRRIRDEIERRVTMLAQVQQQQEEEKSVRGGV